MPTYTTLANFSVYPDGVTHPNGGLTMDAAGNLFGVAGGGVFEIARTANGYASTPTLVATVSVAAVGNGGLTIDAAGDLFGTLPSGGANYDGSAFEIAKTASGYASTPTTLVDFTTSNDLPTGLIIDANGNLFGTTEFGGTPGSAGTAFEIANTASGYSNTPTTLVNFKYNGSDGWSPSPLVADAAGDLFGTTVSGGGANGLGTIFEIAKTADGYASTPTTLASFNSSTGTNQFSGGALIADAAGDLFGITFSGGANGYGTIFEIAKTAGGYSDTPITLVSRSASFLGGGLVLDAAGNIFGVTSAGGANGDGTIFEIAKTANGYASAPATVYTFGGNTGDGINPNSGLTLDSAGNMFGTTSAGGVMADGTAFEIQALSLAKLAASISGTAQVGQTLTASASGTASAGGVAYQWQELVGGTWTNIAGATGATYLVQQSDEGDQIQVQVIGDGGFTATSAPTKMVPFTSATSLVASLSSGVEHVGDTVTFTFAFDRAVTVVGGTPTIPLGDGGSAVYDAAATAALGDPTKLVFSYTVATADVSVTQLYGTGLIPNGARIIDRAGIAANPSTVNGVFTNIQIDTPPTALTSVVASAASGAAFVGDTVTLTLAFNRGVTVSGGTPALSLNDGGTAVYNAAATAALGDPTKLVFSYTVAAANASVNTLATTGGALNGATIADSTGHLANLSGITTSFPNIQVDTASATLTSVVASPSSGVEHVGDTVTLTLAFSSGVTVSGGGTPTLALNDGGTAFYDAAATAALGDPTKLVFSYTVAAADNSVNALAIVSGSENGAYISDSAGRGPGFSRLVTSFPAIQVVGRAPTVLTSVLASAASSVEHVGDTVTLTMAFSSGVTVSGGGTPTLALNDGGTAFYDAAATAALADPTKLVFSYTVATSDISVNALAIVSGNVNGAHIADGAGQVPDFSGLATSFPTIQVATPQTAVTSLVASSGSGVEHFGDTVTLTMTMNQSVTVSGGTPILMLNDGGTAIYNAAATAALGDPSKLLFSYTVGNADQSVSSLSVVGASLNGANIVDANGNAPNFSAIYSARFASLSTLVGIDLGNIAFGPQTSLAFAYNDSDTGGTLTVTDTIHSSQITLLNQYAVTDFNFGNDFHLGSDFHGGTVVSAPGLTGAAQSAFLASAHT